MNLFDLSLEIQSKGLTQARAALGSIDTYGKQIAKDFESMSAPINRMKGALLGVASAASGVALVAIGAMLKQAISEAGDAEAKLSELRQAVNNVGGDFELLKPATDKAADSIERLTRFSDEAARGALTTLIQLSGDTAGSLKNLGLAADIATARHMSFEAAAELVGRTMAGNLRGLKQLGITTKDSAVAMEELRKKFSGFAEADGKTFQGRLEQIHNAWNNVLEAVGKNIVASGEAADGMGAIRDKLVELEKYITANGKAWHDMALTIVDQVIVNWKQANLMAAQVAGWLDKITAGFNMAGLALNSFLQPGNFAANAKKMQVELAKIAAATRDIAKAKLDLDRTEADVAARRQSRMFGDVGGGASSSGTFGDVTSGGGGPTGTGNNTPIRTGGAGGTGGRVVGSIPGVKGTPTIQNTPGFPSGQGPMGNVLPLPLPDIDPWLVEIQRRMDEAGQKVSDIIQGGFAQTLGDAIYNAFSAAFNGEGLGGIFKAFGKTVLAGVGSIFTQLGMVYLEYGGIMQALAALLPNPFTAGYAGLAIGAALIAMGSALGAVASGAGRGTASSGAFRERATATADIVKLKFVDRNGNPASNDITPRSNVNVTIIGTNDPKAQREITELIKNADRRAA